MIVTIKQITDKIKDLPPDYAEHVHCGKPGNAEVESFSDPTKEPPYTVHIEKAETEGMRKVVCTCEARTLCDHITAFYAVAKGIKPEGSEEPPKTDKPKDKKGKETPSEEIKGEGMTPEELEQTIKEFAASLEKIAEAAEEFAAALAGLQK